MARTGNSASSRCQLLCVNMGLLFQWETMSLLKSGRCLEKDWNLLDGIVGLSSEPSISCDSIGIHLYCNGTKTLRWKIMPAK